MYPGNLSGELYEFVVKFKGGGSILKIINVRQRPFPRKNGPLRKNLKNEVEVDNNPC